jgi:hypothetical protein
MRRFVTVGAAVACSRSRVDGWTGGRVDRLQNARGPSGNPPQKNKQPTTRAALFPDG